MLGRVWAQTGLSPRLLSRMQVGSVIRALDVNSPDPLQAIPLLILVQVVRTASRPSGGLQ